MSQNISPPLPPPGDIPADLRCGFCKKPVQGEYYRTLNRFACSNCVAQLKAALDRNILTSSSFIQASAAGLLVGLVCAVVWAVIVHVTGYNIGYVASLIGYAVGKTVYTTSGKKRGRALQWLAAVLSVIGIVGGKLMLAGWGVIDVLKGDPDRVRNVTPATVIRVINYLLINHPSLIFDYLDVLWIGIAVYAAWRICKFPTINIAGPYPLLNPTAQAGLQFQTMDPASNSVPPVQQ